MKGSSLVVVQRDLKDAILKGYGLSLGLFQITKDQSRWSLSEVWRSVFFFQIVCPFFFAITGLFSCGLAVIMMVMGFMYLDKRQLILLLLLSLSFICAESCLEY